MTSHSYEIISTIQGFSQTNKPLRIEIRKTARGNTIRYEVWSLKEDSDKDVAETLIGESPYLNDAKNLANFQAAKG